MSQSERDCQAGSMDAVIKGCMSLVLRSFFSYQVAVGSTMSLYRQVVLIRKSTVHQQVPSLPWGTLSVQDDFGQLCFFGTKILALHAIAGAQQVCLRKYSWPLPDEQRMFERQTNMFRGQLSGWSGSVQLIFSVPSRKPLSA